MTRHRRRDPICRRYRRRSTRTALGRYLDRRDRGRACPICCPPADQLDRLHLSAPADIRFVWRSSEKRTESDRAADALALKPSCTSCGVIFDARATPPASGICRACRRAADATPADPSLF